MFQIVRNLRGIEKSQLRTDASSMVCSRLPSTVDDFNSQLKSAFDVHAPSACRQVTQRKSTTWYSSVASECAGDQKIIRVRTRLWRTANLLSELRALRQERQRANRQWLASGLTVHKQIMNSFKHQITKLVTRAKTGFHTSKVAVARTCKELLRLSGSLVGKVKVSPLPSVYPQHQLPQVFSDYFCARVAEICDATDKQACTPPSHVVSVKPFFGSVLTCFHTVTEKNVRETIQKMPPKTCELDSIPASLLLECIDEIAPVLTDIVNACLSTGSVPDLLKQAIVKPHLKKSSLDSNIPKNFRPVSNLPFVSKLLEKSFFLNCLYTSNATICGIFFSRRIDRGTAQTQPCFVSLTVF